MLLYENVATPGAVSRHTPVNCRPDLQWVEESSVRVGSIVELRGNDCHQYWQWKGRYGDCRCMALSSRIP